MEVIDVASLLARVSAVGAALDLDVQPVIERAASDVLDLGRLARVGIGGAGDRLRLIAAPAVPVGAVFPYAALAVDPVAAESGYGLRQRAPRGADCAIELAVHRGGGLGLATTVTARWSRADALDTVAMIAPLDPAQARRFAEQVDALAGRGSRVAAVTARFSPPRRHTMELALAIPAPEPDAGARIVAACDALGVPSPQRDLLAGLHPVLSVPSRPTAHVTVYAADNTLERRLAVAWHGIPFELVAKVLVGLGADPEVTRRQLAALADASAQPVAAAVELTVGGDAPDVVVDVELGAPAADGRRRRPS